MRCFLLITYDCNLSHMVAIVMHRHTMSTLQVDFHCKVSLASHLVEFSAQRQGCIASFSRRIIFFDEFNVLLESDLLFCNVKIVCFTVF